MALSKQSSYEMDMCSGAILPKMLQFTLPLMFSGILQLLFNAADIIVVGRFAGDNALAAVGSNTSLINLLINLFIGLSVGANILAARFYGAKEQENLRQTVHTAMLLSLISGAFLAITGICSAKMILTWMQSPANVRALAATYLRIYFLGMPATMLYNFGAALLRAVGDTKRPLYYLFTAGVINVALNLVFVISLDLSVVGVAIATVISQCVSAFLVVRCMIHETGAIHLDLKQLRIYPARLKQILQVGLPAGFQGVLFSISNVLIQSSINSFGETIVAANAAAANIETFIYVSMNSFYQSTVSFVSQNYGAGKYERIDPIMRRALACVITVGLVLGNLATLFGSQLLSIYSDSPDVIAAGMQRLLYISVPYALCGIMDVMVGGLRGLGYSVLPMLVSMMGACVFRVIWILTIFKVPAFHTMSTLYLSYPISWVLTFLAHFVCYFWAKKRLRTYLEQGKPLHTF